MTAVHDGMIEAQVKPGEPWRAYLTRTVESLRPHLEVAPVDATEYGGRSDRRIQATGFYRAVKIGHRWWLADPTGALCIHLGVTSVRTGNSPTSRKALGERFGNHAAWADHTAAWLRELGFHGTGAWSDARMMHHATPRLAYTPIWNFMSSYGRARGGTYQAPGHTGYRNGCIFVFEPEFAEFCEEHAKQLASLNDDPYLLGHFTDNELPVYRDLLDRFLALDPKDPGYRAAREWVFARKGRWPAELTDDDRDAFRGFVFEEYARITTQAIRRNDPNHLILGPRLHGDAKFSPAIFKAVGKYLDVIGVNFYGRWVPELELLRDWERWSGRPSMITEFYTKGADSGCGNTSGAGWIVRTQRDRGLFYQTFALQLLESACCVGWQWFKYMDNDPDDHTADPSNRDANKGIVTVCFEPYEELVTRMKELNDSVYAVVDYFDRCRSSEVVTA